MTDVQYYGNPAYVRTIGLPYYDEDGNPQYKDTENYIELQRWPNYFTNVLFATDHGSDYWLQLLYIAALWGNICGPEKPIRNIGVQAMSGQGSLEVNFAYA